MYLSELDLDRADDDALESLVFSHLRAEKAPYCQAALVLGCKTPNDYRTPEAVRQYKSGNCGKLVMSGGVYWDTKYGRLTEAESMRRCALEQGVPDDDIVTDNLATTTIENMICGMLAMNRAFGCISAVKDLMLVTSLYHMRRSLLIADALIPKIIRVHPCPAAGPIDAKNWKDEPSGRRRVRAEAGYIKAMAVGGMIDDIRL